MTHFRLLAGAQILTDEIRAHCEPIHKLATPLPGQVKLVIGCFGEHPGQLYPRTGATGPPLPACVVQVEIGDSERTIRTVANLTADAHDNAYTALAVFRPHLRKAGKASDATLLPSSG